MDMDKIKAALGCVVEKAEAPMELVKIEIDLEKVSDSLVSGTADVILNIEEDPKGTIEKFEETLDSVGSILDGAVCDEDGNISFSTNDSDTLAKSFSVDTVEKEDKTEETTEATEATETEANETDVNKSEEFAGWESDMAPANPPTLTAARLTKSELPISARSGRHSEMRKKHDAIREKYMMRQTRSMS